MMRNLRVLRPCWGLLLPALLLGLVLSTTFSSPAAHAAQVSQNPSVAIAVDGTTPACVFTRAQIVGPSHTHKLLTQTQCPAGTFMKTQIVSLAQAQAQHDAYVLLPAAHASAAQWLQYNQQISQVVSAKRQQLQARSLHTIVPLNDCGQTLWGNITDTVAYDRIDMQVQWQVSSSCSSITIDTAWLQAYNVNSPLWWNENDYAGYGWRNWLCPSVGTNNISFAINASGMPKGYDLVYDLQNDSCPSTNATHYYPSYGPLN
jgi:hypothetical protein